MNYMEVNQCLHFDDLVYKDEKFIDESSKEKRKKKKKKKKKKRMIKCMTLLQYIYISMYT
uniref:Uncharacterized protein n=1 Tax=Octopus bimaculoides TaxID=37653 RepID=A0A0L8FUR7_OCTBM